MSGTYFCRLCISSSISNKREVLAAAEVDEHGLRVLEQRALVEQRAVQRVAQRLVRRGPCRSAMPEPKRQRERLVRSALIRSSRPTLIRPGRITRRMTALIDFADHVVGRGEGFVDALLGEHEFAHAVVVEGDQRVGKNGEFVERGLRLFAAAVAFEGEGHGGEDHDERAFLAGDAGDDGRGTGAGAAAETGAEENDAAALDRGADLLLRLRAPPGGRARDRRRSRGPW